MKRNALIFTLIAGLGLAAACTSEEVFQLVFGFPIDAEYEIDESDGFWVEEEEITYQEIEDEVQDLIEEGIEIDDINFETVILFLENQDPALQGVQNVDAVFIDENGNQTTLFEDVMVTIPPGQTGVDSVVVTELIQTGVEAINDQILKWVNDAVNGTGDPSAVFTLVSSGESLPNNIPLSMDLTVQVRLGVLFSEEVEVPGFLGNQ